MDRAGGAALTMSLDLSATAPAYCLEFMKLIRIFEHEAIRQPLSNGEKDALEKLRGPNGQKIFEFGWRDVKATSFVGIVQLGPAHNMEIKS